MNRDTRGRVNGMAAGAPVISLLCPTRGRPDNVRRFAASALDTAADPRNVELVFYVDQDDVANTLPAVDRYRGIVVVGPRCKLAETWNRCAEATDGTILGHMGDDVVFHTQDWDRLVTGAIHQFEDQIVFVHGRDGVHDQRLGTHGFVHRNWIDAIGYLTPPYFSHDYCDTWLNEVADAIGRRVFLPELETEHLHPDVGKAEYDQTYRDHQQAGERDGVARLYDQLAAERNADAAKLREVMA